MRRLVFVLSIFLIVGSGTVISGQGLNKSTGEKRITIQATDWALQCVIIWLVNEYDIAFGFEESTYDANHVDFSIPHFKASQAVWKKDREDPRCYPRWPVNGHRLTLKFTDAKLEDVLNALVRQMGDYRWEISDEVVNIIPLKGQDPVIAELLDLRIGKFKFDAGTNFDTIRGAISFKIPEINEFFKKRNLYPSGITSAGTIVESTEDLDFSNIPLRDLLNKITRVKRGSWSISREKNDASAENTERKITIDM